MVDNIDFKQDTERLRDLISQVDNSGVLAWEAGELLKKVKYQKTYFPEYKNFDKYTKSEFDISPQTANNYILINERFSLEEIGKLMLVTHLRVIAEINNDSLRQHVLKVFKDIEENSKNELENDSSAENTERKSKSQYRTNLQDVIATVSMLVGNNNTEYSEAEIRDTVLFNIEKGREEIRRKKRAKKIQRASDGKDKFGNKFTSEYFKVVSSKIDYEPINEMGVVGLFCLMFPFITSTQFLWKNEIISFEAIKYIRAEFPDASIRCKSVGRKNFELDVEFEFESYNYIRHGHLKQNDKCDLIVCWDENARTDSKIMNKNTIKSMPPILSLKKCFETGKIELI